MNPTSNSSGGSPQYRMPGERAPVPSGRPSEPAKSKLVPILAGLSSVALVAGAMIYQKYYRKTEVVAEVKPVELTNTVAVVEAQVDLFPGRRNANGIFYVPVKQAQDTVAVLAATAAAATNQASQAEAKP